MVEYIIHIYAHTLCLPLTHTHTHAHTHILTLSHTHKHTHTHTHTHTNARTYTNSPVFFNLRYTVCTPHPSIPGQKESGYLLS